MSIKIHNVRLGLATNSSSTHSLIFLPDGASASDSCYRGEFGWDFFTAKHKDSKLSYLGILLYDALRKTLPENAARAICANWNGWSTGEDEYVDHQSFIHVPSAFGTSIPDEEFFKELRSMFLRDDFAILGGNDNDNKKHPLKKGSFVLPITGDGHYHSDATCRRDPSGYWVIFNRNNGSKIRFSFANPGKEIDSPEKAHAPELVDVKITDYCPMGCPQCYMGSTEKGLHADEEYVHGLARALAKLKVFEVAIGGGEPTMSPDFVGIIRSFRERGVVPNFTTKSLAWLRDPRQWAPVIENCGAFALSVDDADKVSELAALLELNGIDKRKASVQVVTGYIEGHALRNVLEAAWRYRLRVTLLGYKDSGRGRDWRSSNGGLEKNDSDWLGAVKYLKEKGSLPLIGVDTVLAAKYDEQIQEAGVQRYMYTKSEGAFSCYIDAVKKLIGPSSYCDGSEMTTLPDNIWNDSIPDKITESFATF